MTKWSKMQLRKAILAEFNHPDRIELNAVICRGIRLYTAQESDMFKSLTTTAVRNEMNRMKAVGLVADVPERNRPNGYYWRLTNMGQASRNTVLREALPMFIGSRRYYADADLKMLKGG